MKQTQTLLMAATCFLLLSATAGRAADTGPQDNPVSPGELSDDGVTVTEPAKSSDGPRIQKRPVPDIPPEARVPDTMSGDADCDVTWQAPSLCEWQASVDALIIGVVETVTPSRADVYTQTEHGWEPAQQCKYINPGITVTLRVDEWLSGKTPEVVEAHVGWGQVQHFDPLPYAGDDGDLRWTESQHAHRGPLEKGKRVIMGLHNIDGMWSLMGDTLFGIDTDNRIHMAPRTGDCMNIAPPRLHRTRVGEAKERVAECRRTGVLTAESRRRSQTMKDVWGKRAIDYYASSCATPKAHTPDPTLGMGGAQNR